MRVQSIKSSQPGLCDSVARVSIVGTAQGRGRIDAQMGMQIHNPISLLVQIRRNG